MVAVMLSGLFAGLAGVLYALQNQFAAPDLSSFWFQARSSSLNVIGGIGTLVGPIVGAAFFLLLREGLSRFFTEYYLIFVGLISLRWSFSCPKGCSASHGVGSIIRSRLRRVRVA